MVQLSSVFQTRKQSADAEATRKLHDADIARDDRHWPKAAALYAEYLESSPDNVAIWVQLGHALKESGSLLDAEAAYKRSLELNPVVADTHLQLGHLYKRQRKISSAIHAYQEAFRLDPTLADASRELRALGFNPDEVGSEDAVSGVRMPGILIDLSDVYFYLRHHATVSGIQRVQLGIAKAIIATKASDRAGVSFLAEKDGEYVNIDDVYVLDLSKELLSTAVDHSRLKEIMETSINHGRQYSPVQGDILLILGAFWVLQNVAERIISLRRLGVRVGALIHDIIPITHPEFCEKDLTDSFRSYFYSVLGVVNFILTVSDYSGSRVRNFMTQQGISPAPILTLRSAHKTWDQSEEPRAALSPAVAKLLKENYVLYVSTIEIRKNHTYLFRIWKRLLEENRANTPRLVFVGRMGWRVQDLRSQLQSTDNLNGMIQILHDLSDYELSRLYRSAMFTVFPSFEEGWGLPVGESLMFGRPCVASQTSSVPEVAADFVDYIDPYNLNDGYDKIVKFIDDGDFREGRAEYIKSKFVPRQWSDVARDLIKIVRSADYDDKKLEPPRLEGGRIYRFGHGGNITRFVDSGDAGIVHFAFDTDWYPVENFGRWMKGRRATIAFSVDHEGDQPVVIAIETHTVTWSSDASLHIFVNDVAYPAVRLRQGARQDLRVHAVPDRGNVVIDFHAVGDIIAGPDPRRDLWFGVGSLGYARNDDALARVKLLEELVVEVSPVIELKGKPGLGRRS